MQINPAIPSYQTQKPTPQLTPAMQMAMSPAVQAAQQTAPAVRTQTVVAPQAPRHLMKVEAAYERL